MKIYWRVMSKTFDDGKTSALVSRLLAESKPENRYEEREDCDVYIDWFDSKEEAEEYAEQTRNA